MEDIKCSKCGNNMVHLEGSKWHCSECDFNVYTMSVKKIVEPKYIKQESRIDDKGIWVPVQQYALEGTTSTYKMIISRELFVEAYNKWIKENE